MFRRKSVSVRDTASHHDVVYSPILAIKEDVQLLPLNEPPLTVTQQAMLDELRGELDGLLDCPTTVDKERRWLTDHTLLRYLRATRWQSVSAAKQRLHATLEWRRVEKPDEITAEEVHPESLTGKTFISGFDKYGRTVLIERPGFENTKTYDRQIRHQIFNIERALHLSKCGSIAIIIDFTNVVLTTVPPFGQTRQFLNVLQNHYPETLGLGIMLDSFYVVTALWKMVQPFLDPVTKSKIVFASSKIKHGTSELAKYIDQDQLAIMHGGPFQWKHDEYWKEICKIRIHRKD